MTTVMTLDRICDGLMGVPFIIAVFLRVRAEQFQRTPSLADLEHVAGAVDIGPRDRSLFLVHPHPESIAENVKIVLRSEEHTSELQSLMRISYAVFCLKKKK